MNNNYYVYLLTDPRKNNEIFYCGKGKGDRWKSHLGGWSGNGRNSPTANKVESIKSQGMQPGVIFLHENITDEREAYDLESDYIRKNLDKLTNIKIDARPPKNTGGRRFTKSQKSKDEASVRIKAEYADPNHKREHWTKKYTTEVINKKISAGDPGKSRRGKPALNRTPIIETTTNQIFKSQTEAAYILNLKQSDISNILSGRQKSTKGYKFIYTK
tara:strand:+ start:9109 stop:9756 length:648 start_codon:yes stop_codon:yes gene_type:complete